MKFIADNNNNKIDNNILFIRTENLIFYVNLSEDTDLTKVNEIV